MEGGKIPAGEDGLTSKAGEETQMADGITLICRFRISGM